MIVTDIICILFAGSNKRTTDLKEAPLIYGKNSSKEDKLHAKIQ